MVRVVFDTVVFVRGLINPSGRWGRLLFDRRTFYQLVVSPPVTREIAEVIGRPTIARLFRPLPGREPSAVIAMLEGRVR